MSYVIAAGFIVLAVLAGTAGWPLPALVPFLGLMGLMFATSAKDSDGVYRGAPGWVVASIPAAFSLFLVNCGFWGVALSIPGFVLTVAEIRKRLS